MTPEEQYDHCLKTWSDIQGHLPTLRRLAKGNVLEIGVRGGVSTAALLMGVRDNGGHLWSLDVDGNCAGVFSDANWTFIKAHSIGDAPRVLNEIVLPLDVLFVDSSHIYEDTVQELDFYGSHVRPESGLILMHDTDMPAVKRALEEYGERIGARPSYASGSNGLGILLVP